MSRREVNERGETVIPASVRPDGSVRRERRVRPGYTPQEEVPLYRPGQGRLPVSRSRLAGPMRPVVRTLGRVLPIEIAEPSSEEHPRLKEDCDGEGRRDSGEAAKTSKAEDNSPPVSSATGAVVEAEAKVEVDEVAEKIIGLSIDDKSAIG